MIIYWFKKLHLHKWEVVKLGEESCDPFYIYDCDYPIGTIKKCIKCGKVFQLQYYSSGLDIINGSTIHKIYTTWSNLK